jgi:hypothetical protein
MTIALMLAAALGFADLDALDRSIASFTGAPPGEAGGAIARGRSRTGPGAARAGRASRAGAGADGIARLNRTCPCRSPSR